MEAREKVNKEDTIKILKKLIDSLEQSSEVQSNIEMEIKKGNFTFKGEIRYKKLTPSKPL